MMAILFRSPHRPLRLVLAAALIVPLAACATKRDVRDLQETIQELHAQNQALLRDVQREQRVIQDTVGTLGRAMQENRAETMRRLAGMEDHLFRIQELTGLSQQQLAAIRDEIERERAQSAFGPPGALGPGAIQGGSEAAEQYYTGGVSAFNRGLYSTARGAFQELLERFGNDPLAPEARFYLAEILVEENRLEEAIDAFLEIPQFHPDAERVPTALYRVGRLHLELGNRAEAEEHLERVVNTWPDSGVAQLARETLEILR